MIRRFVLTVTSLAILAATTNNAEARNLFNRQADPAQSVEALPILGAPAQHARTRHHHV